MGMYAITENPKVGLASDSRIGAGTQFNVSRTHYPLLGCLLC